MSVPQTASPAPAVEAKSLSSLTALAFNPPAYPRNPTHVRNNPLVLYIARVPGSKDVFLSPMKPRDKVVTAEDIQSSLYFVHVEQPQDAGLVEPPEFQEPNYHEEFPTPLNTANIPAVARKAVPHAPGPQSATGLPARKPVPGTLAPISNFGDRHNVHAGTYSHRSSMLGPDHGPRRSFDATQYRGENDRPAFSPRRSYDASRQNGTALVLIRRDPASGAQWNVARIEDPNVLDVSSSSLNEPTLRKKIGTPMYVEVTNPGYSKFLHTQNEGVPPKISNQLADSSAPSYRSGHLSQSQPVGNQTIFRRRLWMEGSQSANGEFGHRKNSSFELKSGRPDSGGNYDARTNRLSMAQTPDRQSGFRGYAFLSPWNGRCEFITGGGGGSLKCRHIVPGLQGAPPAAAYVSELRFNLPGSSSTPTGRGEESKRSSFFRRGVHSRNNSAASINRDESEEVRDSLDRLDLSLGQEFAGGGFGGKQAKLGKIIIDDEGLKMIDLLVAANIGLWWRAYQRGSNNLGRDRGSF